MDQDWKEPRCVQACPTGALRIVKVEDAEMEEIVKSEILEIFHPEYNTKPRVYYKNLYRYTHCFIAGSIAVEKDGVSDCAQGATVTLIKENQRKKTVTDTFGDFKFDGLEENSGTYRLEISYRDWKKKTIELGLATSLNVGTFFL